MQFLRKSILASLFITGALLGQSASAQSSASATTNVVVNFPEVLVLYTFSDVTLNMDAAFLKSNLGLGTIGVCTSGNECVNAGAFGSVTVDATSEDLDIASDAQVPADGDLTDITLTLENAIGARSLGMTDASYTLGVVDGALTDVLEVGATQATSFTNTGLALSTQDLEILIDVSEIDTQAESTTVNEDFVITVSGT